MSCKLRALQVGALQSTASARLPEVLKVYATSYAQVAIAVETGTSAELIDKVIGCVARAQVRSQALARLIDVITGQRAIAARASR